MASASPSITEAKKALRERIKGQLSELSSTEIGRQSREVTDQVLNLPAFEEATRISVYLSMPEGEISTANIVKHALRNGKKVFVPHIQKSSKPIRSRTCMEMLALRSQEDLDSLQPDAWGIPTLEKSSLQDRENALGGMGPSKEDGLEKKDVSEGLDLILLPGMAFDQSGGRLGHGKGFYDRFLQNYWELASRNSTRAKMPRLAGLALKQQLLLPDSIVPMTTDDWKVDLVIASP